MNIIQIILSFFQSLFSKRQEIGEDNVLSGETIENNEEIQEEPIMEEKKILNLLVRRTYTCTGYTIGKLFIDGEYFCDTIEDCDRGLNSDMTETQIAKIKIKDETAIPTGEYEVNMETQSPKYSNFEKYKWAKEYNGVLPRIQNVPGYAGVLIHVGNKASDTSGCLLVGKNTEKGMVTSSTAWFRKLMNSYLLPAHKDGYTIMIKYVREY